MKINLPQELLRDLSVMANLRKISVNDMIMQILANGALIEKFITPEDNKTIMAIYNKYLHKKH